MTEYETDQKWMALALGQAREAYDKQEVPVGVVIVKNNQVISQTHNLKEQTRNPLGHAEILAIHEASKKLDTWRLSDCTLYVTLEPCLMCVGAIAHARLGRLVYGARDLKAGAIHSVYTIFSDKKLNHCPHIVSGVLEPQCSEILSDFFRTLRTQKISDAVTGQKTP